MASTIFASRCCTQTPAFNEAIPAEFRPKLFSIDKRDITLSAALAALQKQTGNHVFDRCNSDRDPKITLSLDRSSYWKSLDAIARAADVRLSLYEDDGKIALVNGGYRATHIHYEGLFRFAIKRIVLVNNILEGGKTCTVTFDAAWAPRFEPLYMEVGPSKIIYASDKNGKKSQHETPSRGTVPVYRSSAAEIGVAFPGPARSVPHIESLRGTLSFIAPVEMLAFEFNRLKPILKPGDVRTQKKKDHEVRITRLATKPGRWSFDVKTIKPAGEVQFDSFQSWMHNNRIMLVKDDGVKKTALLPEEEEPLEPETETGAAVSCLFVERNGQRLGNLADWRLVYVTAGRIVRFSVPYSFQKLPLP